MEMTLLSQRPLSLTRRDSSSGTCSVVSAMSRSTEIVAEDFKALGMLGASQAELTQLTWMLESSTLNLVNSISNLPMTMARQSLVMVEDPDGELMLRQEVPGCALTGRGIVRVPVTAPAAMAGPPEPLVTLPRDTTPSPLEGVRAALRALVAESPPTLT